MSIELNGLNFSMKFCTWEPASNLKQVSDLINEYEKSETMRKDSLENELPVRKKIKKLIR